MTKSLLTLTAALLCVGTTVTAQPAAAPSAAKPTVVSQPATTTTLKVGDKAPALSIAEWVKGDPITGFEKGKVYVVEFWATWCGPCVAGMPHLSALQKEYKAKGVTVIGVTSVDPNNSLDQVKKMVGAKGDTMGYTVAWDTERQTNTSYMKAAKQNGIPCSFLVDQTGTVVYIGHPMWLDKPISEVVGGTWDIKAGNEAVKKAEAQLGAIYQQADSDPKGALKTFDEFEKAWPAVAETMSGMKFTIALNTKDYDLAYGIAGKIVDKAIAAKSAETLNEIAWTIVDPEGTVENKNLDLAFKAANKACEFTNWKDGAVLDTLARVYFEKGDLKKAVETQTKAVEVTNGQMKASLEATLKEYQDALAKQPG